MGRPEPIRLLDSRASRGSGTATGRCLFSAGRIANPSCNGAALGMFPSAGRLNANNAPLGPPGAPVSFCACSRKKRDFLRVFGVRICRLRQWRRTRKKRRNTTTGYHFLPLLQGRRQRTQSVLSLALRGRLGGRGRHRFRAVCISRWLKLTSARALLPVFALRKHTRFQCQRWERIGIILTMIAACKSGRDRWVKWSDASWRLWRPNLD